MNRNIAAALKQAHSPAARAKATKTLMRMARLRSNLAAQYNTDARHFTKANLEDTMKRLNIPLTAIPVELLAPFKTKERKALLARRANGGKPPRANGQSIPLEAIPERKKYERNGNYAARKGHPNAELISKVLDQLGNPKINDNVADRLLHALDKLVG